jgi:cell division protease FtsH
MWYLSNQGIYDPAPEIVKAMELAKDKVLMGVERKSRTISDAEKKHTAFHEAGHALVAAKLTEAMPLHKVTIIPRGMTLGVTMFLPEGDQVDYTKDQAEAQIAVSMAGRIADEMFCNMKSAGASNDIEKATELARKMVCEWGMSELGPLSFGKKDEQIFLGREIATHRDYSESTAMKIDEQVRGFITRGYDRAKTIMEAHREAMIRIADALLEREVLDAVQVKLLIEGEPLPGVRPSKDDKSQATQRPDGLRMPGLMEGPGPQPA